MNIKKKTISIVCILSLLITIALTGCNNTATESSSNNTTEAVTVSETQPVTVSETEAKSFETVSATVKQIDQYGDVRFDIEKIDLEYGDSVNVTFSGGYELKDIPYYPDFYGNMGSSILTNYFPNISVAAIGCSLNKTANIQENEKVVIELAEKGKYKKEYEAYNISNGISRLEGQTVEEFMNAREITAGQIQSNRLYRSPSPFDEKFGRVEMIGEYLKEHQINVILDMADTEEKLNSYKNLPEYTASMISSGKVIPCRIGVDYLEAEAMKITGKGLTTMANSDGPYLIHCNLGRDRTGVICAVLEALCGATYQEIVDDYMVSYDKVHRINMDPSSLQYKLFKLRIDEQLEAVLGISIDQLSTADLKTPAHDYLSRCGMSEESIELLINKLTSE